MVETVLALSLFLTNIPPSAYDLSHRESPFMEGGGDAAVAKALVDPLTFYGHFQVAAPEAMYRLAIWCL